MTSVCIWVASLKPSPPKIVLSTGGCSMSDKDDVSLLVIFSMGPEGFPFDRHGGGGGGVTRLSFILLIGWEPLFISSWFHF